MCATTVAILRTSAFSISIVMESILATFPFFTSLISANLISSFVVLLVRHNLVGISCPMTALSIPNQLLELSFTTLFFYLIVFYLPAAYPRGFQVFCSSITALFYITYFAPFT